MTAWAHRLGLLVLGWLLAGPLVAQTSLSYHFEHPALSVRDFTLTFAPDGHGTYHATVVPAPRSPYIMEPAQPIEVESTLTLQPARAARLFAMAAEAGRLGGECGGRQKDIAFSGTKTLRLLAPKGGFACTYNYSDKKPVALLTGHFTAMGTTLEEGRKLEQKHRFDRLGLDAEMTVLADAYKGGRAEAMELIAPTLRALADDVQVLERVRKRAAELLATIALD